MCVHREAEVLIVCAGLAGSMTAAMLQKAGIDYCLVDPRTEYTDEFRCEKFNAEQIKLFQQTGLAEPVLDAATPVSDVAIARYGRLV